MRSRRVQKKRIFRLAAVGLSILVGLCIAEIWLRIQIGQLSEASPGAFALPLDDGIHRPSSVFGLHWELVPSGEEPDYRPPIKINSMGYRSPEISVQKPKGTRRIVALGDSITFGAGVQAEKTFCFRVEQLLENAAPYPVRVVNAGVSGYNAVQMAITFFHSAVKYEPDLLIVNFFNDDLSGAYQMENTTLTARLERKLLVFRMGRWGWRHLLGKVGAATLLWEDPGMRNNNEAYASYESLFAWAQSNGARMMFVIHPDFRQRMENIQSQAIVDWCKERWIPYIKVLDVYRVRAGDDTARFSIAPDVYNPHPNDQGHALIAQAIYDLIIARKLLPDLSPPETEPIGEAPAL